MIADIGQKKIWDLSGLTKMVNYDDVLGAAVKLGDSCRTAFACLLVDSLPKAHVVATADAFAKTGEILLAQRPAGFDWSYPVVVNLALSIELYLKSFLAKDDLVPYYTSDDGLTVYMGFIKCLSHEHKLTHLYKQVPENIKILLEVGFDKCEL
ncbi:MAG: hypothetical protein J0653_03100, partial [Deltaproteobacteria bacterium]|nr:hypothetical protein [Deltaproteobacteria bacterium]